jgi:hypothetical protein
VNSCAISIRSQPTAPNFANIHERNIRISKMRYCQPIGFSCGRFFA